VIDDHGVIRACVPHVDALTELREGEKPGARGALLAVCLFVDGNLPRHSTVVMKMLSEILSEPGHQHVMRKREGGFDRMKMRNINIQVNKVSNST
jgi:hypothetical protein